MLYVNINILHVDINKSQVKHKKKSYVNIITCILHVDIIYLGQKYPTMKVQLRHLLTEVSAVYYL